MDITIDVVAQNNVNSVAVTLTIEQLSSCLSEPATGIQSEGPFNGTDTL